MPLVIVNRSAIDMGKILELKRNLLEAQNLAQHIQRTNNNATDSNIEAVFGIPQANVTQFKSVIDSLVNMLESPAVEGYLGVIN